MAGTITASVVAHRGSGIKRIKTTLTCAGGVLSATEIGNFYGRIVGVAWDATRGAGATMTAAADITVTDGDTGATILTLTDVGQTALFFRPTAVVTDFAGAAITAAATAVDVNRDIYVCGPVKVAIAAATATDTGGLDFIIDEGM